MQNLETKVAVVTGAGAGIGRATALALAGRGATVAVCDIDESWAKEAAEDIVATGGRASAHRVDVADEQDMRALVDAVLAEHGVVDVVVNNAGITDAPTPAADVSLDRFRMIMAVNFWGVVHGSLFFLPHLVRRPEANLVNVASCASFLSYSRFCAYASSKFAVRGFSESLRMELAGTSVHVTVVCPGSTKTSILAHSPVAEEDRRLAMQQAFDRAWGRPPEGVAQAIVTSILKNTPRALVGPDAAVLDAIVRLVPGAYSRLLAPSIKRYLGKTLADTP